MNIYQANYPCNTSAYIQAENLIHGISRAKRLGRVHFHTQKVFVRLINNPTEQQIQSAKQAHFLLNEPFQAQSSEHIRMIDIAPAANIWQEMANLLDEAGL